ncbi:MAG: hypothetical protein M3493_09355 [Actinomycetota bacterium]|nr:hypothetical protein [Actinomycetota bacterium]
MTTYQPDLAAAPALISVDTAVSAANRRGDSFFMGDAFLLSVGTYAGAGNDLRALWLEKLNRTHRMSAENALESAAAANDIPSASIRSHTVT